MLSDILNDMAKQPSEIKGSADARAIENTSKGLGCSFNTLREIIKVYTKKEEKGFILGINKYNLMIRKTTDVRKVFVNIINSDLNNVNFILLEKDPELKKLKQLRDKANEISDAAIKEICEIIPKKIQVFLKRNKNNNKVKKKFSKIQESVQKSYDDPVLPGKQLR